MDVICVSVDAVCSDAPVVVYAEGPRGPAGPASTIDGAGLLTVAARLSEFDTPEAKAAARQNLELQQIDCGTFN